mmetsp:Transcript_14624/g.40270  ORF Transcript_14624/g.40270 Transcript_14624/m.40270 type:complete len:330 (-) Transcript_14624:796-1785(-)
MMRVLARHPLRIFDANSQRGGRVSRAFDPFREHSLLHFDAAGPKLLCRPMVDVVRLDQILDVVSQPPRPVPLRLIVLVHLLSAGVAVAIYVLGATVHGHGILYVPDPRKEDGRGISGVPEAATIQHLLSQRVRQVPQRIRRTLVYFVHPDELLGVLDPRADARLLERTDTGIHPCLLDACEEGRRGVLRVAHVAILEDVLLNLWLARPEGLRRHVVDAIGCDEALHVVLKCVRSRGIACIAMPIVVSGVRLFAVAIVASITTVPSPQCVPDARHQGRRGMPRSLDAFLEDGLLHRGIARPEFIRRVGFDVVILDQLFNLIIQSAAWSFA